VYIQLLNGLDVTLPVAFSVDAGYITHRERFSCTLSSHPIPWSAALKTLVLVGKEGQLVRPCNCIHFCNKTARLVTSLAEYKQLTLFSQYSETNVMHILFSLLRIKGLYTLRALVAHPQDVQHKWHSI
jgi:hypothetical protein